MILGLDFGTTNSGAAVYDGSSIHLLHLDPFSANPTVFRSAIYITLGREYHLGSKAVNLYFQQNIGRPTRYRKIWVGEILQVFAELPPFFRDVYVYEDEFSPGRLFLSIKTVLRNPSYLGTVFQDQWYSASDLAAVFLMGMRLRAESYLGAPVTKVVLGRPVHFSASSEEEKTAQSRLLDAAFKAGFETVYLEFEPVAAALSYERTIEKPETVLVFDFGGGTLDITVMELAGPGGQRRILATGGIAIAGDIFDQRLFRAAIPKHLGEGDVYYQYGRRYPIPADIFDLLTNPQEIISLNTPQHLEMLRTIHAGARNRQKTDILLKMVSSNYSLLMFDVIERAKCQLSEQRETDLTITTETFSIKDRITRSQFEAAIHKDYEQIRLELLATLERSGLDAGDIDRVVRTGGSSQIPLFNHLLNELFGAEKVRAIDTFSSVTSGLGVLGHLVERGEVEAEAWTADRLNKTETITDQQTTGREDQRSVVQQVNLGSIQKQLLVANEFSDGRFELPGEVWVILGDDRLEVTAGFSEENAHGERDWHWAANIYRGKADQHLLAVTGSYKLQSIELGALYIASQSGEDAALHLFHLEMMESAYADEAPVRESLVSAAVWSIDQPGCRYICLATNSGQLRSFDSQLLAGHIRPRPYFQLEKRYTGIPFALLPSGEDDLILLGTTEGRVGKAQVQQTQVAALEVLKIRKDERVCAARAIPGGEQTGESRILAVNEKGAVIAFQLDEVASSGKFLGKNFKPVLLFTQLEAEDGQFQAITSRGRILDIRLSDAMLKPGARGPLFSLHPGERIVAGWERINHHLEVEN